MSVAARSIGEAFVAIAGRDRVRDDADALAVNFRPVSNSPDAEPPELGFIDDDGAGLGQ